MLMTSEEKGDDEKTENSDDAEQPNAAGKKELQLEDMQLWAAIDLNKDGKLTVAEYERLLRLWYQYFYYITLIPVYQKGY